MNTGKTKNRSGSFSLGIYLLIVFALTWPFQIAYVIWGKTQLLSYGLSSISMIMVAVGTFIAGRYVFKDNFADAGWNWGKPRHYLSVIGFAVLLWVLPTFSGLILGSYSWPTGLLFSQAVFHLLLKFSLTLVPAFGEEFGWRGYLFPRFAQIHTPKKAVLLHAVIWWAWHLPAIVGIGIEQAGASGTNLILTVIVVIIITLIPSAMHAVIYAYIWARSQSLAVATVYHAAYDEIRDTMQETTGMIPITDLWTNLVITLVGIILLLKVNWKNLFSRMSPVEKNN
ncbi:MAG: CPBP family intramembrane glutamic endopeptidase [Methanosarcina sp.]